MKGAAILTDGHPRKTFTPHHRATFWKFLSQLLGEDAKTATKNCYMILGDRNKSYRYLMEGFRWVDSCFKKKQKRLTKISS